MSVSGILSEASGLAMLNDSQHVIGSWVGGISYEWGSSWAGSVEPFGAGLESFEDVTELERGLRLALAGVSGTLNVSSPAGAAG